MNTSNIQVQCGVCGETNAEEWLYPREMMLGLKDQFSYFRCSYCDCLQIHPTPPSLNKYYPDTYYSYGAIRDTLPTLHHRIKRRFLYFLMVKHKLGWGSHMGRALCRLGVGPNRPDFLAQLDKPIARNESILDVGSGTGAKLLNLRECGFTQLRGIDPYINKSILYSNNIRIDKMSLSEVQGTYGLIMLHHVFEHLDKPLQILHQIKSLLKRNGQLLIRIPLSDSYAAKKYRENWVQLDAPRHLMLHTRKSMDILAESAGLRIAKVTYDSSDFQFWASEEKLLGIPLNDPRSYGLNQADSIFSLDKIHEYSERASKLNLLENGDQAAFILVNK